MDLSMSDQEVEIFIAEQKTCRLATLSEDGFPHVVPVWYVMIDGGLFLSTSGGSKKSRNVSRDPRAALVIDHGDSFDDFKGVTMTGTLEEITDAGLLTRVWEAMAQRYFGSDRHPGFLMLEGIPDRVTYGFNRVSSASWTHGT